MDDDADMRVGVADCLGEAGHLVVEAANGAAALEALAFLPTPPCLVLLDLSMPVMDGRTFLRQLRDHPRLQHVPVCIFTAETDLDRVHGAQRVIRKPIGPQRLIECVAAYCDRDISRHRRFHSVVPFRPGQ